MNQSNNNKAKARPAARYIDADSLAFRPMIADRYVPFLIALVRAGQRKHGEKEWGEAHHSYELLISERERGMIDGVADDLKRAIVNERIRAFRWWHGIKGPLLPMPTHWLALDRRNNLPKLGSIWDDKERNYIFLDRSDFIRFMNESYGAKSPQVQGVDVDKLSPYLRLAITVAMEECITEKKPQTVEALVATLMARAPEFGLDASSKGDLSESFAKSIAKAMRWPSARLGRAMGGNREG